MSQPIEVAGALVQAINRHDVPALAALLTDEHVLVDALDNTVYGRAAVVDAWQMYFDIVSDYEIEIEATFMCASVVALFGRARGRMGARAGEERWDIPWACLAETRGERAASWRIYCDNEPARRSLARAAGTSASSQASPLATATTERHPG